MIIHFLKISLCMAIFQSTIVTAADSTVSEAVLLPFVDSSGARYLFDINQDSYEDYDVINDSSYAEKLALLEERRLYWANLTIDSSTDETVKRKKSETLIKSSFEQIYDYDDAPHIVYVLIDDWGYNDFGARSTYLSWTTPTLNKLADEGILLENYYTSEVCGPSRGALLTGRYPLRLGIIEANGALPLTETTLAEELQTAGYRSYIVGKWHLGKSSTDYFPTSRGFDYFYGYPSGYLNYWTKKYDNSYGLYENTTLVTDESALDESLHSGYLFQTKVEEVIKSHATDYPDTPMFLYYPMQLVHFPWTAPEIYLDRCSSDPSSSYNFDVNSYDGGTIPYNYCAMMLMMDEAIANLTCTLSSYGFSDNTVLIIAGDNGGEATTTGSNYPFKGFKDSAMRGAFSNTAIIHSTIIPSDVRGSSYTHDVHITDWLPTIMGLATGGAWNGSYTGADIDGVDVWDDIMSLTSTGRSEMVLASKPSTYDSLFVGQIMGVKYIYNCNLTAQATPDVYFVSDLNSDLSYQLCSSPSLLSKTLETRLSAIYKLMNLSQGSLTSGNSSMVLIAALFMLSALFLVLTVVSSSSVKTLKNKIFAPTSKVVFETNGETVPLISRK